MLAHLRILNLAIIEGVELELGPGLNVLTGETGAGKSIIVEAAAILRGARASAEMVRTGAPEATVEAQFDLAGAPEVLKALETAGLPLDGEELLVRRVISASGRGRIYINGALSTAAVLSEVTARLLDISGQHEQQLLEDRGVQRRLLDAAGVPEGLVAQMAEAYGRLSAAWEGLARLQLDERQRAERVDYLRYQVEELAGVDPRIGEDEALEAERRQLGRAGELLEAAAGGEAALYGDEGSVSERIAAVEGRLDELSTVDGRLGALAGQLREARVLVEDAAQGLARYAGGIEDDPTRLEEVGERLEALHRLKRKYGGELAEVLARGEAMRAELEELEAYEVRLEAAEGRLAEARSEVERAAEELSRARQAAAGELSAQVAKELSALSMKGAQLAVELTPLAPREDTPKAMLFDGRRVSREGWDRVELLVAANPGEAPRPLAKTASGGELSRIMLALKQVLGRHDPVRSSIYDEVDAGVGGAAADAVGRSLARVAKARQVLCVTHLPQVAAYADRHFHVGKASQKGRTRTAVALLTPDERVEELARMLGSARVTEQARANARALIASAGHAG